MMRALLALTRRAAFMISAAIVLTAVIVALAAPWLPLPDPNAMDAPPYDPAEARARSMRDYVVWGCVGVMLASVIALGVWFVGT